MHKSSLIGAMAAVLVGGGLLWTAGKGGDKGVAGWETLNAAMVQAVESGPSVEAGGDPNRGEVGQGAAGESAEAKAELEAEGGPERDDGGQVPAGESAKAQSGSVPAGADGRSVLAGSAKSDGQRPAVDGKMQGNGEMNAFQEAPKTAEAEVERGDDVQGQGGGSSGIASTAEKNGRDPAASVGNAETTNSTIPRAGTEVAAPSAEGKVNINTAGITELTELPGIGEKKAQAIVDYRRQHGLFRNASDLGKVKGIGPKVLEKLKPHLLF